MIEKLKSKVSLNIQGRNINRFIKKLTTKKINILSLKYKNKNEVNITVYKKDLEKVQKIKSIYNITELDVHGFLKIKQNIKISQHIIIITIVFFILFLILTNIVFDVEVIHSKKEIRNLLTKELASNGLKKYTLKKSYKEINKIKEKILNKYPDEIEWLEIEPYGTKYIVRVEERKIVKQEKDNNPRNIIAKKSGVLRKVIALKGDIVKDMDDYVNKGDLIVNGELIFNNKVTGKVKATGTVYAEVWYVTKTEYPFAYYSKKPTGKVQDIYTISFLNHSFELTLHKFKTKNIKEKILLQNPLIPFKITKQHQSETKIINQVLTFEQALNNAEQDSINKVKSKLNKNEYIIRSKYLKSTVKDSTMEVEMFFAVYEDITAYQEIG